MNRNGRNHRQPGFTLIEILVTLVILAVLVAAVFPVVSRQIDNNVYPSKHIDRWRGAYIDASVVEKSDANSTGDAIETGYNGQVQNEFYCYDAGDDSVVAAGGTCNEGEFVAVKIMDLVAVEFEAINDVIDGTGETDGSAAGQSQKLGKFRYDGTNAYYLLTQFTK